MDFFCIMHRLIAAMVRSGRYPVFLKRLQFLAPV
jgi:hypothetical protein